MIMAAAIGEGVIIDNVIPLHLEAVTAKLREMGVKVEEGDEQIFIPKQSNLKAVDIKTLVYPGFPTDLQQPFTVLTNTGNRFFYCNGYHLFCSI